jgi:hypothetical protein
MDRSIKLNYYYNNVPNKGLCRNNLIYTSLINDDNTIFCQWYFNDRKYHGGHNEVVDSNLMKEKWKREVDFLSLLDENNPEHIPIIKLIDHYNNKIFLEIQDVDFWQLANCDQNLYNSVLPDWQEQMLEILKSYRQLGIWKYSLHPSSYFIVDGKLKSINYFFTYYETESKISIKDILSHISLDRREKLYKQMNLYNINLNDRAEFSKLGQLALDSFSDCYPLEFINKAKEIYV